MTQTVLFVNVICNTLISRSRCFVGLQGEEHGSHASGHRGIAEEQQERLHRWADWHRPIGHVPLGGAAGLLQGPGCLQGGWEETPAQKKHR